MRWLPLCATRTPPVCKCRGADRARGVPGGSEDLAGGGAAGGALEREPGGPQAARPLRLCAGEEGAGVVIEQGIGVWERALLHTLRCLRPLSNEGPGWSMRNPLRLCPGLSDWSTVR